MSFTKGKRTVIFGIGIPFVIDAVNSEGYSFETVYTKYPVEFGRLNSDHGQDVPDEVELNILITDTPTAEDTEVFQGRFKFKMLQLEAWKRLKAPLILVTNYRSFVNMHIAKIDISKQPKDGKSINVNIKFVELQNTLFSLGALAASGLVDTSVTHAASEQIPLGLI